MHRNIFYSLVFTLCFLHFTPAFSNVLEDSISASVYAYFNITDDDQDSSLSFDTFSQQIDEIGIGNYTVLSLTDLLAKESRGEELSPNTIAITFDEPDADTYAKAIPLLLSNKIPFTIFISPGNADDEEWDELNRLKKNPLVTIGLTSFSYGHLGSWDEAKITEDLNKAKSIYREHFSAEPLYFAYPLGEYSTPFVAAVTRMGFAAAFGQNSGVVTPSQDKMRLPRFTMTDDYGDLERFQTTSNALPFPVKDMQPDVSYVTSMPVIGFTVDDKIAPEDIKKTKCFASGTTQPETLNIGTNRIEVRFAETPVTDRLRINCTIPVPGEIADDEPSYRWLGFLLYFPVVAPQSDAELSPVQP